MQHILIGNDINVNWKIYRNSSPENLDYYTTRRMELFTDFSLTPIIINEFTIQNHIISFTYRGSEQTIPGKYSLRLILNDGLEDMHTIEYLNAFCLTNRCINQGCPESDININPTFTSEYSSIRDGKDAGFGTISAVLNENGGAASVEVISTGPNISKNLQFIFNNIKGGGYQFVSKSGTKSYWNAQIGFIPLKGEIIVYTDYSITNGITYPNIKIGDGLAYVQDLPFVKEDERDILLSHINNEDIHVNLNEKDFWNNKLNVTDTQEVIGEVLIFNRN